MQTQPKPSDIHDLLDPVAFVESLSLDQVGFLAMYLKGSTNRKYFPLRKALDDRLRASGIVKGLSATVFRRYGRHSTNGRVQQ